MVRTFSVAVLALVTGCGVKVEGGAGGSGGDEGSGDSLAHGAVSGVQHAACTQPTPDPMPELPPVNVTADGRPRFDLWRDLDCGDLAGNLCGAAGDASACEDQHLCLQSDAAVGGACTYVDSDMWCDGEGEVLGYGDGSCWLCAPIEAHAAACCAGLAGFDCRAWPYPADGKPGMACARHEDCEPGLVCGAPAGKGYGICQCPGLAAVTIQPSSTSCGF